MLAQARADVGIVVSRSNAGGVQAVQWSLTLPSVGASLAATAVAAATLATPAHAHGGFFLGLNFGIPFAAQDPYRSLIPTDQNQPRLLHASRCRWARRLLRRRDIECDPAVPAGGPVLVAEFPVAFEIEITLKLIGQGNDVSELRPRAHNRRLEAAHVVAGAGVATDLLVDVADGTDKNVFRYELRRAPIEMHVDAVLILGRLIGEIVGEAEHARELVPRLRIEISVARAGIDRAVPNADIRETGGVVGSDRHAAGDVGHVVVNARVPAQRRYRQDISEPGHRVADGVE